LITSIEPLYLLDQLKKINYSLWLTFNALEEIPSFGYVLALFSIYRFPIFSIIFMSYEGDPKATFLSN